MEQAWVSALADGDSGALEEIMNAYQGPLFGYAARLLHCREEARDVVQDAFLRLWRHRQTYRGETSLKNWLFKITRNLCLNRLDLAARKTTVDTPVEDLNPVQHQTSADQRLESDQQRSHLARALQALPDRQRQVVLLRTEGDFSFSEIAEVLDIAPATARTNYFFAVKRLKKLLHQEVGHEVS